MNILHLCSYYIGNELYKNLFLKLNEIKHLQTVYIPIKNKDLINRNHINADGLELHYDLILKKYDRYLYKGKIKKQKKSLEGIIKSLEPFDVIHAHTLFSDGGTAYLLKKKYGVNYIVSVRNTDINYFYKYAIHLRPFIYKVLKNASGIVFISHAYKRKAFDLLPSKLAKAIESRVHIVPNGIDENWFTKESPTSKNRFLTKKINLLFIGSLDKNKNLAAVLKLLKEVRTEGINATLNVAGNGPLYDKYLKYADQLKINDKVKFHGYVPKEELINLMDQSTIFILPSYKETFGISYIEAMSRGVPIIYTKNEGIDGYFLDGAVGYSVNPDDVEEMKNKLNLILKNYKLISRNCLIEAKQFNWNAVTDQYVNLYKATSKNSI
ncbi:glycogen synthase [Bacillus freudenreichii]|nr:glycogen synthase [Bacillus freudenreichii]